MALLLPSCIILWFYSSVATIHALPPTEPPLIHNRPFVVIWNAPTNRCHQLEIPLDMAAFQAVTTPAAKPHQFLTVFYENRFGLYPRVNLLKRKQYKGGIPQEGNLTEHLAKVKREIDHFISQDSAPGLAVIDWEAWRPLWNQNWGSKHIYQKLSVVHTLKTAPFIQSRQVAQLAKSQFQKAGRQFMEKTISLGKSERPSRRWGFYLFPDCHNYKWEKPGYTGKCSNKTEEQNNQMLWLWERSTAFFPSVYLQVTMRNSPKAALYVRNRVQEALRVAALPKHPYTMPVYVYSRPLYRHQTQTFLSQMDLVSTMGESVALGASGVILWGSSGDYSNKANCQSLSDYLTTILNPYVANVTAAAVLCSQVLCQGRGRCARKNYDSTHYLHLNPAHFSILRVEQKYVAVGFPSNDDLSTWAQNFTCQCYAGQSCSPFLSHPANITHIWV
ncbi:hyaluronidase PH-20-like [Thalassophryne amazonica]|uniref:hyaluronidase PH-20-like n=1 Tax=Thalassophryne amazonica TaxID=390379 RepID=UPI0014721550|nr:hyaluronidase PH-20-like [Thalassophryne amazonica]